MFCINRLDQQQHRLATATPATPHLHHVLVIDAGLDVPNKHRLRQQRGHSGNERAQGAGASCPAALILSCGREYLLADPVCGYSESCSCSELHRGAHACTGGGGMVYKGVSILSLNLRCTCLQGGGGV